jgi:VWFA-related protein
MKKETSLILSLIFLCSALPPVEAQQPPTLQPAPARAERAAPARQENTSIADDDVVRITTNLVQVDAVVVDKDGRQVTDLRAEDFEVFEDGKPQPITNLTYVSTQPAPAAAPPSQQKTATKNATAEKNALPVPPTRLRPEDVRRRIVLVVDDLTMSMSSAVFMKRALNRFIEEQMQEGDLVAIFRTRGGIGALQQFTNDKRQLRTAINSIRAHGFHRRSLSADDPFASSMMQAASDEDVNRDYYTVGTLGALNLLVRGLRELPGRKAIMLFSDSLPIFTESGRNDLIVDSLDRLVDSANRASVVIYTTDTRGLETLNFSADMGSGSFIGGGGFWTGIGREVNGAVVSDMQNYGSMFGRMRTRHFDSQEGMSYLARRTGGLFNHNTNDIGRGLVRMLDDQRGYYLIAYRPDESIFDPQTGKPRFHKIEVKVKRAGLKVRSRTGFIGVTDEEVRRGAHDRNTQLSNAYASLFTADGVDMRLTSIFSNEPKTGSAMRSLLYIDARDLSFSNGAESWERAAEAGGARQAVIDILATTFDGDGRVVDQHDLRQTIQVSGNDYQRLLRRGLEYVLNVPVKKAGAYQLRVAVRDATSHRIGSASQFIEVPNLGKNRLTMSGIVLKGTDPTEEKQAAALAAQTSSALAPPAKEADAANLEEEEPAVQPGPAVRRIARGMMLDYGYHIYNAQLDPATRQPQLQTQLRLFRDGQQIYTSNPTPFDTTGQTDFKRLLAGGRLGIGPQLPPGEYVLQIVVTDPLAKNIKHRAATQWIDFEIVK